MEWPGRRCRDRLLLVSSVSLLSRFWSREAKRLRLNGPLARTLPVLVMVMMASSVWPGLTAIASLEAKVVERSTVGSSTATAEDDADCEGASLASLGLAVAMRK